MGNVAQEQTLAGNLQKVIVEKENDKNGALSSIPTSTDEPKTLKVCFALRKVSASIRNEWHPQSSVIVSIASN